MKFSNVVRNTLPMNTLFFFFTDAEPAKLFTLSLHDALPISLTAYVPNLRHAVERRDVISPLDMEREWGRSEEHTSELQSPYDLVCRLLLEKKKFDNIPLAPVITLPNLFVVHLALPRHAMHLI